MFTPVQAISLLQIALTLIAQHLLQIALHKCGQQNTNQIRSEPRWFFTNFWLSFYGCSFLWLTSSRHFRLSTLLSSPQRTIKLNLCKLKECSIFFHRSHVAIWHHLVQINAETVETANIKLIQGQANFFFSISMLTYLPAMTHWPM